jgi:hypothetical protein
MYYYTRPGYLVPVLEAGKVTAIDTNNNVITVNNVNSSWTTGVSVSVQSSNSPFDYKIASTEIVSQVGYTIYLDDVSEIELGDYVCSVNEAVFPQIPVEGHNLLLQAAKVLVLEALDDERNMESAKEKFDMMAASFMKTITPRVVGASKKVSTNNNIFHPRKSRIW